MMAMEGSGTPHINHEPIPVFRKFQLLTGGANPDLDALKICSDLLKELEPRDRDGVIKWLSSKWKGKD